MKKHIRNITTTIIVLFALLGITGTVAYASGYITWGGSNDYHATLSNLEDINTHIGDLKYELGHANHSKEELKVIIQQKEQIILTLEKEIEDLKNSNHADSKELDQAEKDMKHLKEITDEMVEEIK